MGDVVALDLVVYGVAAGVGGLGQFRIVRTAIQLILQRAAGDAAAGIDQHLLRAIEGQAGLGGGCSCDRCGRQIYNRKMQLTGDDTGVVAVCGIGVSDVTRVTQLQRLQLFHDSVITGRAIIAVSQRSRHITESRCIKGALVHHDLNVGRSAFGSHIFLLNDKGLAHGVGVIALTGHGRGGCTHIGIVFIGHRVIGSSGQGLSSVLHGNSRLDGAAGVGLGRDTLYHIGSQSLGFYSNTLLSGFGDITLGIADCDLFVIYSQGINRGKLEVGGLHIFGATIIVLSSDHHSRLVELLTRGISRMRAGLNGNAGQGLLGRGGEGLGQREMRRIGSDNFVALSRGCVVQGLGKTLAGFRRQGDLGSVDLIGCRRAGHGRAGGGVALVPIHCAGVGRCATQINCGVQRHTLDRGINRGGHAGDGRCKKGDGAIGRSGGDYLVIVVDDIISRRGQCNLL